MEVEYDNILQLCGNVFVKEEKQLEYWQGNSEKFKWIWVTKSILFDWPKPWVLCMLGVLCPKLQYLARKKLGFVFDPQLKQTEKIPS